MAVTLETKVMLAYPSERLFMVVVVTTPVTAVVMATKARAVVRLIVRRCIILIARGR
jgi:hypothetical protein